MLSKCYSARLRYCFKRGAKFLSNGYHLFTDPHTKKSVGVKSGCMEASICHYLWQRYVAFQVPRNCVASPYYSLNQLLTRDSFHHQKNTFRLFLSVTLQFIQSLLVLLNVAIVVKMCIIQKQNIVERIEMFSYTVDELKPLTVIVSL